MNRHSFGQSVLHLPAHASSIITSHVRETAAIAATAFFKVVDGKSLIFGDFFDFLTHKARARERAADPFG
jgi:hypothetical protein